MLILIVVVILMCILIPVIIGIYLASSGSSGSNGGGYPYYPVDPYDDDDYGVTILNIQGRIEVDHTASTVNVTMTHNGGDPVDWGEYQVNVAGISMTGYPTNPVTTTTTGTTSVGESAMWTISNAAGTFVVGSQYTIKVIVFQDSSIAWQKDITAIAALWMG